MIQVRGGEWRGDCVSVIHNKDIAHFRVTKLVPSATDSTEKTKLLVPKITLESMED